MQKNKRNVLLIGLFAVLLLAGGVSMAQYNFSNKDRAFPNVYLNGKSYTDTSFSDAQKTLENRINDTYKDKMKFTYADKTYELALTDIGIHVDTNKTMQAVFAYGHRTDLLDSVKEQAYLLNNTVQLQNELADGDFLIAQGPWDEMAKLENPAQNVGYKWNGSKFITVAPQDGNVINREKLKADIKRNLATGSNDPVKIELVKETPTLTEDTDGSALKQAQNLIAHTVVLKNQSESWTVDKSDLGSWIGFMPQSEPGGVLTLAPDEKKIKEYLNTLAPQINREPVNAQLEFKDGKVGVFALSKDGSEMDIDATTKKIGQEVFQEKNYAKIEASAPVVTPVPNNTIPATAPVTATTTATSSAPATTPNADQQLAAVPISSANTLTVEIAVKKVAPELTTNTIDNMGITTLLATGQSNFHGSTNSRRHNIAVGAGKFNGVLIGPGDTFSFDTILGSVDAKTGYLPELVIKSGKTIPEYGGGLCQVSTTAFRGAVLSGLQITARTNHAYAVKYYAPQGTDATIYPPNPDLQFVNNTPAYILLQTRIDGDNLYFDFYGTSDGRKVETEGPVIYERGAGGAMKTWWKQKVYDKDGKLMFEKTFNSNYKSAALYPTQKNPLE
jgi:vancomycin resistance protein YoaR